MVQWLRLHTPKAGSSGLIPGWGTKIPYAMRYAQKQEHMKTQRHTAGLRAESGMSVTRCKPRNLEDSHFQKRDGGTGPPSEPAGGTRPAHTLSLDTHLQDPHRALPGPQFGESGWKPSSPRIPASSSHSILFPIFTSCCSRLTMS